MRRDLFPSENEELIIMQGTYGSCYLLAAFYALWNDPNSRKELRDRIKFTDNGQQVSLRLKKDADLLLTEHRKEALLERKIGVQEITDQHGQEEYLLTLPKEYLDAVDSSSIERISYADDLLPGIFVVQRATQTNAFSLMLLEHIIPYFFMPHPTSSERFTSLQAHSSGNRKNANGLVVNGEVLPQLMGITVRDIDPNADNPNMNLLDVVSIKNRFPTLPLFCGMDGHAYAISEIKDNMVTCVDPIQTFESSASFARRQTLKYPIGVFRAECDWIQLYEVSSEYTNAIEVIENQKGLRAYQTGQINIPPVRTIAPKNPVSRPPEAISGDTINLLSRYLQDDLLAQPGKISVLFANKPEYPQHLYADIEKLLTGREGKISLLNYLAQWYRWLFDTIPDIAGSPPNEVKRSLGYICLYE